MGPTWGRQDPGGPHVGPMELCYQGFPRINVKLHCWWLVNIDLGSDLVPLGNSEESRQMDATVTSNEI